MIQLSSELEKFHWKLKKNCIICGNITINSLSHKDLIHLSELGLPVWVFDDLIRSVGDGKFYPSITSLHSFFHLVGYFIYNIKHCYYICCVHCILLFLLFSLVLLLKLHILFFKKRFSSGKSLISRHCCEFVLVEVLSRTSRKSI